MAEPVSSQIRQHKCGNDVISRQSVNQPLSVLVVCGLLCFADPGESSIITIAATAKHIRRRVSAYGRTSDGINLRSAA